MSDDRDHADVRVQPPILLLIHLVMAFVLKWIIPLEVPAPQPVKNAGLAILVAGFLFAVGGLAALVRTGTTYHPHGSVSSLVSGGAYRFSRNPIYVGYVCTLIGLPLALGNYWGLALCPVMIHYFNGFIIKPEETYLEKKFGDTFTGYKSRVRRWL
jgi:protein-S-isoprenylcysteine O-methyltransferase Ste14